MGKEIRDTHARMKNRVGSNCDQIDSPHTAI
jgi:hypothetical protein